MIPSYPFFLAARMIVAGDDGLAGFAFLCRRFLGHPEQFEPPQSFAGRLFLRHIHWPRSRRFLHHPQTPAPNPPKLSRQCLPQALHVYRVQE